MPRRPLPDLNIDVTPGDPYVLALRGELDIATAPAFREALLDTLAAVDGTPVAIDASELSFVDSTGLGVLLMGARRFGESRKRLLLRSPSPALSRVIELTGVAAALEIEQR